MSSTLLRVYPSELKIPYVIKRQRSCCMQLMNKTAQYVAFKVKTTNPRKYSVRHTCGILLPRSSCSVTVTMQAPKGMPLDYHCKDKFLVQSVVVRDGATMKDFTPELFTKAPGRLIEEFKLRVVYIAANPPSPVPEEAEEEDASQWSEVVGYEVKISATFAAVCNIIVVWCYREKKQCHALACDDMLVSFVASRQIDTSGAQLSCGEGASVVSSLVGDTGYVVDENQKIQQKMELLRGTRSSQQGFSVMFVLLVFMSSVFIGHLMKHIKV